MKLESVCLTETGGALLRRCALFYGVIASWRRAGRERKTTSGGVVPPRVIDAFPPVPPVNRLVMAGHPDWRPGKRIVLVT